MSAIPNLVVGENSPEGGNKSPTQNNRLAKMRAILHAIWKMISSKLILFLLTTSWVFNSIIFAQSKNEIMGNGSGLITFILGCAVFVCSNFILACLADLAKYLGFKTLRNINNDDPISYFDDIHWHQLACTCILTLASVVYFAGSFTGRPENQYSKIINGKPLLDGDSLWVLPLNLRNQVMVIEKKQNILLPDLIAETADGASIVGSLSFEGQLSSDSNQWFDFKKKKGDFVAKLKEAYLQAVKKTRLADLGNPLIISFETSKESVDNFTDSAILPREGGIIKASDFKVLANQRERKK